MSAAALVALAILVAAVPACAADAAAPNLLRAHFTREDGLPGTVVDEIGQTRDGFLWVITNGLNLVRFDGKTFYSFVQRHSTLAGAPDGDLWVGTREGLLRVPQADLNQFTFSKLTVLHPGPGKETEMTHVRLGRNGVL